MGGVEGPRALSLGGPFGCGAGDLWVNGNPLAPGSWPWALADDNHEDWRQGNKKKCFLVVE
jgi:hypothetical protein